MQGAFRSLAGGERSLSTLKSVLAEKIPAKQAELAQLKKEHGHKSVGEVSPNKELSVWALLCACTNRHKTRLSFLVLARTGVAKIGHAPGYMQSL